jgi:hypothetical protein
MTSTDNGISWTQKTGITGNFSSVTYGNNTFVAVGQEDFNTGITPVMTSTDNGISWTLETGIIGNFNSVTYGNNTFVAVGYNGVIRATTILPPPCFKEDSKILTDKGYICIQELRKGDLVKTLKHNYKAIDMIGKREIYHQACKERIKNQLYKCSQSEYKEVFEPLILTGCHSILVDDFISEEQKQKVIEVNGNTYVTDDKWRLPACADPRASVYETPGGYTIYHLALENDDYYMNYGVYANGLLVETCSKRYLKELSNMTLIE